MNLSSAWQVLMDFSPEIKSILDIGLGALSLMLWFRQGKVNKAQVDLDAKQNQATQDLTTMVKDHEARIGKLEYVTFPPITRPRKKRRP